jgi:penicillin-binding protein 1B
MAVRRMIRRGRPSTRKIGPAADEIMPAKKTSRASRKWVVRSALIGHIRRFVSSGLGKVTLAVFLLAGIGAVAVLNHYYWEYAKIIDAKLSGGPFNQTSKILAAPEPVFVGDEITLEQVLSRLRDAGYSESRHNRVGHYVLKSDAIEIYPGAFSYFAQEPAVLYFGAERVSRIVSLNDGVAQPVYELEPALITHVSDQERSKRRLVRYEDIPERMRNAIIAIEDHRFFQHSGFDVLRTTRATLDGVLESRRPRGTSTLTQQLARQFFLNPDLTYSFVQGGWEGYKRKAEELLIALQLEGRLGKAQIFEFYANQVPLGRSGSFNVMGVGEAARAYFNKDLRELTVAEAALLAGLIQRPSFLNPYRHLERARGRRDTVLEAMLRHDYITPEEFREAVNEEIHLAEGVIEYSEAPYFVDLVNRHLQESFGEEELITQSYTVYTTLDLRLQHAAVEAMRIGMADVDAVVNRQRRFRGKQAPQAQAALVAIDPLTGEVKAIVGGRNYGQSQLNRVLANRQPGSAFKPFVYAAAIDTALDAERGEVKPVSNDGQNFFPREVLTAISTVDDVPTTFWWNEQPYEPANFSNKIHGVTTLRNALSRSMNIATVKLAEMVGFQRVADLAVKAGLGKNIMATPAIALGAYEVTPLDIAAAYTIFTHGGKRMIPYFIRTVRDAEGRTLLRNKPQEQEVLDPRVAYIVTNMLEDVINRGTAVRVRGMGLTVPAAGKTGTDDDGWFAGYSSKLICVVWVGFDDNTDLSIEGAHSALPIWAEFMKRAHAVREYRNPEPFEPVDGIVTAQLDPDTQDLATYACPRQTTEVFIAGSQPSQYCRLHGGRPDLLATNVAGWDSSTPPKKEDAENPGVAIQLRRDGTTPDGTPGVAGQTQATPPEQQKKKGLFGRILDVFR